MSTLSQFAGGGIKQIKTGFIKDAAPSANTSSTSNEDYYYYDVTLAGDPVSDITKCVILFDGASHYTTGSPLLNSFSSTGLATNTRIVTTRLENATTLRICHQVDIYIGASSIYYHTTGRWTLIEYR